MVNEQWLLIMASQGLTCGTGADDASVGSNAWTSPGNITANDGLNATSSGSSATTSHYLKGTNCGFTIPSGATILGIVVSIERAYQFGDCVDAHVRIVKGGSISSTNRSTGASWFTGMSVATFGGTTDLWGETWTPADINATDFGAVLAWSATTGVMAAEVDYIFIEVYYSESGFKDVYRPMTHAFGVAGDLHLMKKNVSGQKIGSQMVSATDGSAFTGSVTVYVTGDAGTQAIGSVGSGACAHEGNGYHTYAPAQAETNYDIVAFTFIGTGAVPQTVQAATSADANLVTIKDQTVTCSGGVTVPAATLASTTNITAGTIATVTTVTNQLTAAAIATGVWQDATAGDFTTASSVGKSLYNAFTADTSVFTTAALANGPGGGSAPTAAQVATAVWRDTTAGDFTTIGSIGKSLFTGGVVPGAAGGVFIAGTNAATAVTITGNIVGTVSTVSTLTGHTPQTGDVYAQVGVAGAGLTALGDTRLANLDAAVSSRGTSTLTQTQVTGGAYTVASASCVLGDARVANLDAAVTTRMATYTQPIGFIAATFPATVASTTNITAAAGCAVSSVGANAITAASLAGDVTTELQTGLATSAALVTAQADLDDIQTRLPAALVLGRIDASVGAMAANVVTAASTAADYVTEIQSGLATAAVLATVNTVVDSILVDTAEIGTAGAGLTALASAANLATANTALAKLDDTVVDNLGTYRFTAAALALAPTVGTAPTVSAIADEVQTRTIAGVTLVTTTTNLTNAPTVGDLTATMKASVTTAATAATPTVTAGTVSDKTGYSLSAGGIQAIWDALTSALTTVGSVGKSLVTLVTDYTTARAAKIDNLDDALSTRATPAQVASALATYDAPTNAEMTSAFTEIKGATWSSVTDTLEAIRDRGDTSWTTATGFSTHSAADVWASATRVLTAGTNIVLAKGVGVTGFNDIAATAVVSAGPIDTLAGAVSLVTALGAAYDPAKTAASQASVNDLPTNLELATALGTSDDAMLSAIAALNNVSTAQVTTAITTALGTYDAPTNAEMLAAFAEIKGLGWTAANTLKAIRDRGDAAWVTGSFSTHSAADVWAVPVRELSSGAGIVLAKGIGLTGLNDLSAAQVTTAATSSTPVVTVSDKTGFSLVQAFPPNFASMGINLSGHVSQVTLVDTTTTNTDMRGTNAAYTGTPPTAGAIGAEVATVLSLAHGAGSWATATGFSTLDATGVRAAVGLATANLDAQLADIPTVGEIATALFTNGATNKLNVATGGSVTTAVSLSAGDLTTISTGVASNLTAPLSTSIVTALSARTIRVDSPFTAGGALHVYTGDDYNGASALKVALVGRTDLVSLVPTIYLDSKDVTISSMVGAVVSGTETLAFQFTAAKTSTLPLGPGPGPTTGTYQIKFATVGGLVTTQIEGVLYVHRGLSA